MALRRYHGQCQEWLKIFMGNFLIYGSYGYTGQLIVDHALQEGLRPILAGRNKKKLIPQAEK